MPPLTLRTETFRLEDSVRGVLAHRTRPWLAYALEDASTSTPRWRVGRLTFDTNVHDELATFDTEVTPLAWLGDLLVVSLAGPEPSLECLHPAGRSVLLNPIALKAAPTDCEVFPGSVVLWCRVGDDRWEGVRLVATEERVTVSRLLVPAGTSTPRLSPDGHRWALFTRQGDAFDDLTVGDENTLATRTIEVPQHEGLCHVGSLAWIGLDEVVVDVEGSNPWRSPFSVLSAISVTDDNVDELWDDEDESQTEGYFDRGAAPSPARSRVAYVATNEGGAWKPRLFDTATRTVREPRGRWLTAETVLGPFWLDDQHLVLLTERGDSHHLWDTDGETLVPFALDAIDPLRGAVVQVSQGRLVVVLDHDRSTVFRSEPLVGLR